MRRTFAPVFLTAAMHATLEAEATEIARSGSGLAQEAHRAAVVTAIVCSVMYLEATVNELFQEAVDGPGTLPGARGSLVDRLRSVPDVAVAAMRQERQTPNGGGHVDVLERLQRLSELAGHPRLDTGRGAYQRAHLVVELRDHLAHFRPEWVAIDTTNRLSRRLRSYRIEPNPLVGPGPSAPRWPDRQLSGSLARWCCLVAIDLVNDTAERLHVDIVPPPWPTTSGTDGRDF